VYEPTDLQASDSMLSAAGNGETTSRIIMGIRMGPSIAARIVLLALPTSGGWNLRRSSVDEGHEGWRETLDR